MSAWLRGRTRILAPLLVFVATPAAAQVRTGNDSTVMSQTRDLLRAGALAAYPRSADSSWLRAPPPYNPGSRTLAFGETLLANLVPWMFNEYVTRYKDITRISPTTWKNNVAAGPQFDDNHFHINMLMHPYAGSLYYSAGRSNGYNFEKSFFFTVLGSTLWECCGESHRPSPGDLLTTTVGGTALGEMLYRWTSQILNRANQQTPRNGWWEVPVGMLSPVHTFTRWTLGRFSATNPVYVNPSSWAVFAASGVRSGEGFFETGYTYGDVIAVTKRSSPFTHFETVAELDFGGAKQTLGRVQARGSLWSRRFFSTNGACQVTQALGQPGIPALSNCNNNYFNIIPFLGFDYNNNNAYEFGGQSIGGVAFLTVGRYPGGTHGVIAVDGHGFFGGVQSEHADLAQRHDPRSERRREYDFTLGTGYGGAGILSHRCLRVSAFYRRNKHHVVNGSSEVGPATHETTLLGATARCRFLQRLGVGVDYRRYRRESHYDPSLHPEDYTLMNDNRIGVFVTLDVQRPLGLFVF